MIEPEDRLICTLGPPDGKSLSARLWSGAPARAILVVAHGHGEHGGSYTELAQAIIAAKIGVDVLAFDFRGHGLSSGRRGVIGRYEDLLDDLETALEGAARLRDSKPVFLLGHSNGALAAIRLMETRQPRVAGLILTNPSLRLIADAPFWKRLAGRALLRVAPWVTLETGIEGDQLTKAADRVAVIDNDPLRHHRISPPTYFGMLKHGPLAIEQANQVRTPTLLILGAADPITAPEAGREFFGRVAAADKTLLNFAAMKHEPLHEVARDEVIAAITRWLDERIAPLEPG